MHLEAVIDLNWLSLIVILGLELLTVSARAALLNASQVRLIAMDEQGERRAVQTMALLDSRTRLRTSLFFTLALLRALVIGLAVLMTPAIRNISESFLSSLATLALIGLLLWLVEFLVEWRVSRNPEPWAIRITPYARFLTLLLGPLLAIPSSLIQSPDNEQELARAVTEDELKTLVDVSQREGVLEQDEREMIFSIFRFGDTLAREIMVPRIDVQALPIETPLDEAVDALLESGHSRVPVYNETIDNILGLLYVKDLLKVWRENKPEVYMQDILRPANFIPETKKVDELLEEMQDRRTHMAIVVDEYGGMAGLVTLEDIVEEIIGEVRDEYDQAEELLYHRVNDEEYLFHGRIDLDDFNIYMGSTLPNRDADTLGGYIYSKMGRVPKGGESLKAGDILLTVEQVIGRRIRRVRARRLSPAAESDIEGFPPPEMPKAEEE